MNNNSNPSHPDRSANPPSSSQSSSDPTPSNYDNLLVGVGDHTWFAPSVLTLLANKFPLTAYLERHAKGDPGETAVTPNEIMAHALFVAEEGFPVISAYYDKAFHVMICFLTNEDQDQTYCFSIQCP